MTRRDDGLAVLRASIPFSSCCSLYAADRAACLTRLFKFLLEILYLVWFLGIFLPRFLLCHCDSSPPILCYRPGFRCNKFARIFLRGKPCEFLLMVI
jgi:hypothetical protein